MEVRGLVHHTIFTLLVTIAALVHDVWWTAEWPCISHLINH